MVAKLKVFTLSMKYKWNRIVDSIKNYYIITNTMQKDNVINEAKKIIE